MKLNIDVKTSILNKLRKEYDELNDADDKPKMISEELIKNQDTL